MESSLFSTHQLFLAGLNQKDVARQVRAGELVQVRRGFYRPRADLTPVARHRLLVQATVPTLKPGAVLSHASAGVLHGLPVPYAALKRVWVTRSRRGNGHVSKHVIERGCPLPDADVTVIDGLSVTSLPRTVADLARLLRADWAVAVADAALRNGVSKHDLVASIEAARRRRGNARAGFVLDFADPRSESPGESRSRVILAQGGLPAPTLQREVWGDVGLVGRTDFAWEDDGVLGEFDGHIKYGAHRRPGESVGDAVAREKLREDDLRSLEWGVVRWVWDELDHPRNLVAKVRKALANGKGRPPASEPTASTPLGWAS